MHDLRLIERPHVHVALGGPCGAGDIAKPCGRQVEARLAVRESTNNASAPTNLLHDPLEWIVGADLLPVDIGEGVVGQRLGHAAFDEIGGGVHPGGAQIVDDCSCLPVRRVAALLGMDSLEHVAHLTDLGGRYVAENVPVEMHHAALPAGLREVFRGALHEAAAGIGDNEPHAFEAAIDQVPQERRPAGLVLLGAFADA